MSPFYDLFVLLDPEAPEERRTAIVEQVKRQIDSGGASLKGDSDWGMRRLSYEIDHRREAQYHLFQFEGTPEVLTELHRALSIDDSVLRHRIIRLPVAPETTPGAPDEPSRRAAEERGGPRDRREPEIVAAGDAAAAASGEAPDEAGAPAQPVEAPDEAEAPAQPVEAPDEAEAPAQPVEAPDDAA
jgi:small subunit ribosomal protein S6